MIELYNGDCLDVMKTLPAGSVDAIITDLPYGTTACAWDEVIPFAPMWEAVKRVLKPRGVFVTTASQPFTSRLVMSNPEWFKYALVWEKTVTSGFLDANRKPLKAHEDILVFAESLGTYNPQKQPGTPYRKVNGPDRSSHYGSIGEYTAINNGTRHPKSVVLFANGNNHVDHPTQKPLALYEYLILTYTNPGETVMDICAGSGTTGVAAVMTGRNAILIEKDADYFGIMTRRIQQAQSQPQLFEGV